MSKHRVVVLKIVAKQITFVEAAAEYGISCRQLHRLLDRYRQEGLDAVEPRSRRPHSNPAAIHTGEVIATNTINPERGYWRNNMKEPGRWPGSQ